MTKHINISLYADGSVPLSWQSSDSNIAKFKAGVEEVAKLAGLVDEEGNALIEQGKPFAVWCTFSEREKVEVSHAGHKIMQADGTVRTAAAPKEPDAVPFT